MLKKIAKDVIVMFLRRRNKLDFPEFGSIKTY